MSEQEVINKNWEINLIPNLLKRIFRQVLEREYTPIELIEYGSKLDRAEITIKDIIEMTALSEEYEDNFIEPFSENDRVKLCFKHLLARIPTVLELEKYKEISVDEGIDNIIIDIMNDGNIYPYGTDGIAFEKDILTNGLWIYLKANNDRYVCAENGGGTTLIADRYKPLGWETFIIEKKVKTKKEIEVDDKIYLKACNGKYVCAENGGGTILVTNRDRPRSWETFIIEKGDMTQEKIGDGDLIRLKAYDGQYISIDAKNQRLYAKNNLKLPNTQFIANIQYLR